MISTFLAYTAIAGCFFILGLLFALAFLGDLFDRVSAANRMVDDGLDLVTEDARRINLHAGSLSNAQATEIVRKAQG